MRARNIKPGFFRNEHIADLPHAARLLFIGLWCMADKRGMLERRPRRIAAEIFPYEPETAITVNSLLDHCERLGFIRYLTDGSQEYIHIPTFLRHQSPHHTEKDSGLPAPENCAPLPKITNYGDVTVDTPLDHVRNPPDSLIPDSLIPDSLIPDSLIPDSLSAPDGADAAGAADDSPPPGDGFDRFWQTYPVKKDKGHARKVWQKIRPSPELTERMLEAIAVQIMEHDARQTATGSAPYWKHPATWLNGECWNDEPMTPDQIQSLTKRNARTNGFTDSNPEHTAALERVFG